MYYPRRQFRTLDMRELETILPVPANESVAQFRHLDASIYAELMRLARAQLGRSGTISMDASSLVHEAYLRFAQQRAIESAQRNVFLAYAARVMRAVVVDYVRERHAQKRGGGEAMITLTTGIPGLNVEENDITHLHETLKALEQIDPRAHVVVEMRYFGGMTEEEVADLLAISIPTVRRSWRKARAFLFDAMGKSE
jgi:RNA polymerase sigma factor (TIGR02999 family)